jgi:poly(A) polymerase
MNLLNHLQSPGLTPEKIQEILAAIPEDLLHQLNECTCYLVGGFIRDFLIGRSKAVIDLDFVVFGVEDLKNLIQQIAFNCKASFVLLDEENQIFRLVSSDWQADFSAPKVKQSKNSNNIEQDLKARDLSINAIAIGLKTK